MSVTQLIKDKIDIVSYVQQYVPDLKKAGRYYKACCPFHGEKTPSFVVNPDTQSWRCFGACAEGGDVITFAQKRHNWSFKEALEELGKSVGVDVNPQTPEQREASQHRDRLRGMLTTAAEYYHQHLMSEVDEDTRAALAYTLNKRGFTEATITHWQIGYAPNDWTKLHDALKRLGYSATDMLAAGLVRYNEKRNSYYDAFRNRLMIPISDERGRVLGFGARALDPNEKAKYINSPQTDVFDKSRLLFGLHHAKESIRDQDTVVIVEGYMDVIQAHQAGFTNVVAQMGTAMTETQLTMLCPRYARRIIMALDSDAAGQNATRRSLEVARQTLQADYAGKLSVDIRILQIDGAKDPDDILRETPELWADAVQTAKPVADFVIDMETAHLSAQPSLQEKQIAARNILPILMASESNMYRNENLQRLALKLRISEDDLLAWAQEVRRIDQSRQTRTHTPIARDTSTPSVSEGDEPPPFIGDEPPPDWFDDAYDVDMIPQSTSPARKDVLPTPKPMLHSRNVSRATEAYCLQQLMANPDIFYQANRKLREIASSNQRLMNGPLGELSSADFSQSDYRMFVELFLDALNHDLDPINYVKTQVDGVFAVELERLMLSEFEGVFFSLEHRWSEDFKRVVDDYMRRVRPSMDLNVDLLSRVVEIRRQRLQRERDELQFLIQDAEISQDEELLMRYGDQAVLLNQAWHKLNQEIGEAYKPTR